MITRALIVLLVGGVGCQPWYRDHERRARAAHDDGRTARELAAAEAAHAQGHDARAAELLRAVVARNPEADVDTYLRLDAYQQAAGRADEGRAYLRWRLAHSYDDVATTRLRDALASSLAHDGQIARALDLLPSLEAALAVDGLTVPLGALDAAVHESSTDPEAALARLSNWLDAYGAPDHALLEAARVQVVDAVWASPTASEPGGSRALLHRIALMARAELRGGHLATALTLYSTAALLMPEAEIDSYRAEMAQASAGADPAALDPDAYALAVAGDAAVRAGRLGAAISAYRRAVAKAPWWQAARVNLAALLAVDR